MMYQDPEAGDQSQMNLSGTQLFGSKQIRHNFIKKVYSLLSIQLLITVAVVALFALHDGIHDWARRNQWFHLASFAVSFAILIAISCMGDLRRKHPHNLIALFAFTFAESLMLGVITVMFETKVVMLAGALTAVICIGLTLFALQTRYDFTTKSGIVFIILLVAMMTLMISTFFPRSKLFILIMSSVMATITGIFLVIDTQMIVGGTHKIQISPEEFVFAAISLYLDIINMFIWILTILSQDSN